MLKTFLSTAASILAATSLTAQSLPEANGDPTNDTIGGAEVAAIGSQHYGTLSVPGDEDHWAISVTTAPIRLTMWTSQRGPTPSNDTEIDLLDSAGVFIANNDDEPGAPGLMSRLTTDVLSNGTYYVKVYPFGTTGNTGDYALDIHAGIVPPPPVPVCPGGVQPVFNEAEPNDTCGPSAGFTAVCTDTVGFLTANDSDFFCFVATGNEVTFETIADTGLSPARSDTELWLYDSACNQIDNNDDGGAGLLSLMTTAVTPGSTYYVEVASFNRGTSIGGYHLVHTEVTNPIVAGATAATATLTELQPPPASICGGSFPGPGIDLEPNGNCMAASAAGNIVAPCTTTYGSIGVATGVDFWEFTVGTPQTWIFETVIDSTLVNAYTDTRLWLYDSSCVEIDTDDDGGAGFLSRLEAELDPGTYYIEVAHWQRNGTGTFALVTDVLAAPSSCLTSAGTQIRIADRLGERANQGSLVSADITGLPPSLAFPAVVHLGFGAVGVNPIPIDLFIIGMPGCKFSVNPSTSINIAGTIDASGNSEFSFPVGGLPAGLSIWAQVAIIDFGAPRALQVTLSENNLEWTVGDLGFDPN